MSTSKDVSSSDVKGSDVNAAKSAVFVSSSSMPNDTPIVTGKESSSFVGANLRFIIYLLIILRFCSKEQNGL